MTEEEKDLCGFKKLSDNELLKKMDWILLNSKVNLFINLRVIIVSILALIIVKYKVHSSLLI